jgi:hypothetical protein
LIVVLNGLSSAAVEETEALGTEIVVVMKLGDLRFAARGLTVGTINQLNFNNRYVWDQVNLRLYTLLNNLGVLH